MNKYLKFFHYLFNLCCNFFDNKPPVSYTVNHETSRLAQQLHYLTTDDNRGICDIALYVGSPNILEEKVSHIHDQTLKEEIDISKNLEPSHSNENRRFKTEVKI
ncbi:MAG: hypothetical protein QNJ65_04880 [Xenococcaceae cyanobacterium MO_234.B1]|nr:hypothetical protein [Xenococcaceae cyanobacterium MO_234.B1]